MLSYQHAYHAGNPADLLKHSVWAGCLQALVHKPKPLSVYETHAGRGIYPLEAPETQKGAEWQSGIGALNIATLPGAYGKAVRALNPTGTLATIPGSPAVATHILRQTEATTDALHLCELHPTEISHLHRWARGNALVHIHQQNGYQHVPALLKGGQRAAVLIDPSYERVEEFAETQECVTRCLARTPNATVVVWVPILGKGKSKGSHQGLINNLKALNTPSTWLAMWDWGSRDEDFALQGTAMVVLGMPFGLEKALVAELGALAQMLHIKRTQQTYTWLVAPR